MTIDGFLNMGGFAPYVWSSYALAAVVLAANVIGTMHRKRKLLRHLVQLAALHEREQGRIPS